MKFNLEWRLNQSLRFPSFWQKILSAILLDIFSEKCIYYNNFLVNIIIIEEVQFQKTRFSLEKLFLIQAWFFAQMWLVELKKLVIMTHLLETFFKMRKLLFQLNFLAIWLKLKQLSMWTIWRIVNGVWFSALFITKVMELFPLIIASRSSWTRCPEKR